MMPAVTAPIGTNQELTEQILKMQKQLATFEEQINGLLIPIQEEITKSKAVSDRVTDQLNEHIMPLINADLKTVIEKVDTDSKRMLKLLDDRVAELITTVNTNDANTSIVQDAVSAEMRSATSRLDFIAQEVEKQKHEIIFEKTQADQRYAMTQSQVALAASQSNQSSGGSMRRSNEPLVTHKLFMNKAPLEGNE